MPKRLDDPLQLQTGSHCLSFHVSEEEAADHAVRFLAGAPDGQAAHYWVAEASLVSYYDEKLAKVAPIHVGCVAAIDHEHVELEKEKLRPSGEIREFVSSHAEGVTGAPIPSRTTGRERTSQRILSTSPGSMTNHGRGLGSSVPTTSDGSPRTQRSPRSGRSRSITPMSCFQTRRSRR